MDLEAQEQIKIKVSVIIPVYNQEQLVIRALESIPNRKDIEIIVIDDGSSDNSFKNVWQYKMNTHKNIILLRNGSNHGVAYTVNRGYDNAKGEYVVLLGSDDYFYTNEFEEIINNDLNDNLDIIYFNLQINNGEVFNVNPETKVKYCGSVKFIKLNFIGNTRCDENRKAAEDYFFYQELLKKKPTEKFTNKIVKHYNFPRKDSLFDKMKKGTL